MPKTYYDSELTAEQIEAALEAIHGVVTPSNNGKVLAISGGKIITKSASEWGHGAVLEPLNVIANGDYTPPTGTDGFNSVHVAVPSATLTTKNITSNGTYNASQDNADGYSSVTVAVPGGATIEPLEVTENGTYNPPSGVDGYAPVTVNVESTQDNQFVSTLVGDYTSGWYSNRAATRVLASGPKLIFGIHRGSTNYNSGGFFTLVDYGDVGNVVSGSYTSKMVVEGLVFPDGVERTVYGYGGFAGGGSNGAPHFKHSDSNIDVVLFPNLTPSGIYMPTQEENYGPGWAQMTNEAKEYVFNLLLQTLE